MFDDIIKNKRKYDLNVIQKDLGDFINNFLWELMDADVSYNFAHKKVIIMFEKARLEFPMVN